MKKLTWNIPLRTVAEGNTVKVKTRKGYKCEHWSAAAKRHRIQKKLIKMVVAVEIKEVILPCKVLLVRLSEREMDYDNFVYSLKWVKDSICELLIPNLAPGRADGDKRIEVAYKQEKAKRTTLRVEIEYGE